MIKAVAFDFFDTLYPTGAIRLFDAYRTAERKVLKEEGLMIPEKEYWTAVEKTVREIQKKKYEWISLKYQFVFQKVLGLKPDIKLAKKMSNACYIVKKEYGLKEPELEKNAKETITLLAEKGFVLGIICDTDNGNWVRQKLEKDNIAGFFRILLFSDELLGFGKGSGKPFKAFINELKKFKIKPSECLMVGDRSLDMDAKKFGMQTVLLNPNNSETTYFPTKPDQVISSLSDIERLVKALSN